MPLQGVWTEEEHDRFLHGLKLYPRGPWKALAEFVGTRTTRQVQSHAQKYQQKIARRERGLLKTRHRVARPEHRIELDWSSSGSTDSDSPRDESDLTDASWDVSPPLSNSPDATLDNDDELLLELDDDEFLECVDVLRWIEQAHEVKERLHEAGDGEVDPELMADLMNLYDEVAAAER